MIAVHHKPRGFLGTIDIQHAAKLIRPIGRPHSMTLIGNNADRKSAQPRRAADQRLAELRFVFVESVFIDKAIQHVAHFVFAVEVGSENFK